MNQMICAEEEAFWNFFFRAQDEDFWDNDLLYDGIEELEIHETDDDDDDDDDNQRHSPSPPPVKRKEKRKKKKTV